MAIATEQDITQELVREKCVRCNRETPYTFADDVAEREYYIPGYGQCCAHCYEEIARTAKEKNKKHHFTDESTLMSQATPPALVMPYNYGENEFYNVDCLGKLKHKPIYDFIKRFFDIVLSLAAIIALTPLMLFIAIIIKITSPGPVLFKQARVGLKGRRFTILKFRSMCVNAEKSGVRWSDGENDARITRVGHILRKFRLDELPQLFCIFIGTMSIVGPRPELAVFYREFEKHVHGFSERLKVKPGLTGLAQVTGGYNLSPQEKVLKDIEYIEHRSILLDLKIMVKTVAVVFSHDGAK